MSEVHIISAYAHLSCLLDQLRAYCTRTEEHQLAQIADVRMSQKLAYACICLAFPHHAIDGDLIAQLEADSRVLDYYLLEEAQADEELEALPLAIVPHPRSGRSSWR